MRCSSHNATKGKSFWIVTNGAFFWEDHATGSTSHHRCAAGQRVSIAITCYGTTMPNSCGSTHPPAEPEPEPEPEPESEPEAEVVSEPEPEPEPESEPEPEPEGGPVCFRFNSNYGSVSAGSCMHAEIVGLHCSADCLAHVSNQSDWSTDAVLAVGQYKTGEQCQKICQSVAGCNFFSLDASPGIFQGACWLKKSVTCGKPFANVLGWVSGPRECSSRSQIAARIRRQQMLSFINCSRVNYSAISSPRARLRKSLYCAMATISQRQALPDVHAAFGEDACNVTVYANADLSGVSSTFPEGFYKALPESVNDDIRSIRVSGRDCWAMVYKDAHFGGWSASFPEGSFDEAAFAAGGAQSKEASAIKVFRAGRPGFCMNHRKITLNVDVQDGKALIQSQAQQSEHPHADYNDAGDYEICDGKELTPPSSEAYTRLDGDILAPQAHCSVGNRIGDDPSKPCLIRLERRTWHEATAACEARGGRLANFKTIGDLSALKDFGQSQPLGLGLFKAGENWHLHGSTEPPDMTVLEDLLRSQNFITRGCVRIFRKSHGLQAIPCDDHHDWICEGTSVNNLTEGVVVTGDLKADEGAFCLWHLDEEEKHDHLPNDEGNGFSNTELACRLQTGSSQKRECAFNAQSRRRGLVSQRGHYSNKANYPVLGAEIGWTGVKGNVTFLSEENAYDAFHCHFTPENSGLLRMFNFQHMYERNYPGALRRTCSCGYRHMRNIVSRCDCTRNGVRSNNCAVWHRETLRRATEPVAVSCNNCNTVSNL